jgi:hypothetical protein
VKDTEGPEEIARLLASDPQPKGVAAWLRPRSRLPGPQANLSLAASFAAAAAARGEPLLPLLAELASPAPNEAPVDTPEAYPAFCAVIAAGAIYPGARRHGRKTALAMLERAAADPRWRMREAAAMGLQLIGGKEPAELARILSEWLSRPSDLLQRAVIAALAHPPLLEGREMEELCMSASSRILQRAAAADAASRRTEGFQALRKGLGYGLSVFTAAFPSSGFALLGRWAAVEDPDIRWIVRENLKKSRLRKAFPEEVRKVERLLG